MIKHASYNIIQKNTGTFLKFSVSAHDLHLDSTNDSKEKSITQNNYTENKQYSKREVTSVLWKGFGYKRSDSKQTTITGKAYKNIVTSSGRFL